MGNKLSKEYALNAKDELVVLDNRGISILHPHILKFKELKVLSIIENKLIDIPELPMIEELYASHNNISAVPNLPYSLRVLDMSFNRLFLTPNVNLGILVNCTKLVLNGNQLEELPNSFKECKQIEELYLDENAFTAIPPVLCTLSQIRILTMNKNKLKRLPLELVEMKGLRVFNINNNLISFIPDEFTDMGIEEFDVSNNLLTSLPKDFGKLHLTYFDISNNQQFEDLPASFCYLPLNFLNISKTKLFAIPDVSQMPLNEFILRDNKQIVSIEGIPRSLEKLDCKSCSLKNLPSYIGECPLEFIDISHNELRSNGIPDSFSTMYSLKKLLASHNYFDLIPLSLLQCTMLLELDLSNNLLITMPEAIMQLSNLEKFYINRNKLTQLPEAIGSLPLQVLEVRENQIGALPKSIGNLGRAIRLDVSHNKITVLPTEMVNLNTGTLQFLVLDDNPLIDPPIEVVRAGLKAIMEYMKTRKSDDKLGNKKKK